MSDRLRDAFIRQGAACATLGSPFMARLMPLIGARLAADTAVGARCLGWTGDVGPSGHSVPLRLAGALHGLVLDGTAPGLRAVYPPNAASDDALWSAVEAAFAQHEARILDWLDRAPQTNEVRRAAAIIVGIGWALARTGPRPVHLSEMGASAGLNLSLDRFALDLGGTWQGAADSTVRLAPAWTGPVPPLPVIRVVERAGVDLRPLDPRDPDDALRLMAYIWPDQPDRMDRTAAAIALCDCPLAEGDAAPWLAGRLAQVRDGLHVVYTTIAAQYFPDATRAAIAASLCAAGTRATPDRPLLHLAMEADGDSPGAGLVATLWSGAAPMQRLLARVGFHGDWIDWRDAAFDPARFPLDLR